MRLVGTKMNNYVTGGAIRALREQKGYTQKQLAERLLVSDKAVSKWESGRGLPDITLIEPLAQTLGVSLAELLSGEAKEHALRLLLEHCETPSYRCTPEVTAVTAVHRVLLETVCGKRRFTNHD